MLAFPMGHFDPSLALRARLALTIIAVVMRGTIARPTKAITIPFAIAPLIPSVVILILMPSVVVLVMLSFLPPIFTVFLFSFFLLLLLLLFPLFLLSLFYPSPLSPCMYIPRASRAPPPRACRGCFPPWPSSQHPVTSSVLGGPRVRLFGGFGRLGTGHVRAVIDKRTGWGLVTVSKAHAAECWYITFLRAVAGSLEIKTTLGLAGGREMVFWTTFAASLKLGRVPTYKLAGNKGLSGNRLPNKHSRDTNTVENGVRHVVASKGNYSAVVS